MIFEILSILLVSVGLVFFLGASAGLLRFPDFYTRMHAAGKIDTLSSLLVILGLAVYLLKDFHGLGDWGILLVVLKLLGICAFIMLTGPTSTHALMDAGYEDGNKPEGVIGRNALDEDSNQVADTITD